MTILGIDPGYAALGWSVIGNDLSIKNFGIIKTDPCLALRDRMAIIHIELSNIIEKYSPTCAAIEKIFFSKNTKTALDVAKVTGAVMLTIWQYRLDMTEYTPNQVKMALTGFGMATKEQMQTMIKTVFKLSTVPKPDDAADALAIALCHSFSMPAFSARSRYV